MSAQIKKHFTTRRTAKSKQPAAPVVTTLTDLHDSYRLDACTLARMLGVSEATLARWQKGSASPPAAAAARITRLEGILAGLARVTKKTFIPTWLTSPNDACEGGSPADLLARGDYDALDDIVYFLQAGEPV